MSRTAVAPKRLRSVPGSPLASWTWLRAWPIPPGVAAIFAAESLSRASRSAAISASESAAHFCGFRVVRNHGFGFGFRQRLLPASRLPAALAWQVVPLRLPWWEASAWYWRRHPAASGWLAEPALESRSDPAWLRPEALSAASSEPSWLVAQASESAWSPASGLASASVQASESAWFPARAWCARLRCCGLGAGLASGFLAGFLPGVFSWSFAGGFGLDSVFGEAS